MKRCPTCNTTYGDEQNFCLNDGQTLVTDAAPAYGGAAPTENIDYGGGGNAPTQVMYAQPTAQVQTPPPVQPAPYAQPSPYMQPMQGRRNPLPWIIVGVVLIAGIVVTIILLTRGSGDSSSSSGGTSAEASKPLSTPTKAYQTFYYAIKNKDPKALKSVMPKEFLEQGEQRAKAQNKTVEQLLQQGFDQGNMPRVPATLPDSRNEKINGDTATLEVQNPEQTGKWDTLYFLKEGDEWKIDFRKMMAG